MLLLDRLLGVRAQTMNTMFYFCFQKTLSTVPFSEVISTRKVRAGEGATLYLELKCGNLFQQRVARLQTDQAHEIARLVRQYITMHRREFKI